MRINSLKKQEHGYLIHTWSDKGYHCKSGITIFAWKVTWNYAYSPFNIDLCVLYSSPTILTLHGPRVGNKSKIQLVLKSYQMNQGPNLMNWRGLWTAYCPYSQLFLVWSRSIFIVKDETVQLRPRLRSVHWRKRRRKLRERWWCHLATFTAGHLPTCPADPLVIWLPDPLHTSPVGHHHI